MLTEKEGADVLLLGLGLWIADRAVQELRRLREELAQIRAALQHHHLVATACRGLRAAGTNAAKNPVQEALFCPSPPVRVLGARPAHATKAADRPRRGGGGGRAASAAPRPG